jgi:aryl-alcohol dehydrogenase-like predicted oxidoreductase
MPPTEGLPIRRIVGEMAGLLESGRARAWGSGMWSADQHTVLDVCAELGVPPPCAAQMATSLVDHRGPDHPEMRTAFERGRIGLVASYVLAGGTFAGKYTRGESGCAALDDSPRLAAGKKLATFVVEASSPSLSSNVFKDGVAPGSDWVWSLSSSR